MIEYAISRSLLLQLGITSQCHPHLQFLRTVQIALPRRSVWHAHCTLVTQNSRTPRWCILFFGCGFDFLDHDARSELFRSRPRVQETKFCPRIPQKSFGGFMERSAANLAQVFCNWNFQESPPSNLHRCYPNHQCLMLKHLPKNGEHFQVRKDILKEKLPNTWRKRRVFSVISQLPKVCGLARWQLSPWGAQFGSFHSSIGQALSFSCWTGWRVRWCCLVRRAASVGFVFREAAR